MKQKLLIAYKNPDGIVVRLKGHELIPHVVDHHVISGFMRVVNREADAPRVIDMNRVEWIRLTQV